MEIAAIFPVVSCSSLIVITRNSYCLVWGNIFSLFEEKELSGGAAVATIVVLLYIHIIWWYQHSPPAGGAQQSSGSCLIFLLCLVIQLLTLIKGFAQYNIMGCRSPWLPTIRRREKEESQAVYHVCLNEFDGISNNPSCLVAKMAEAVLLMSFWFKKSWNRSPCCCLLCTLFNRVVFTPCCFTMFFFMGVLCLHIL